MTNIAGYQICETKLDLILLEHSVELTAPQFHDKGFPFPSDPAQTAVQAQTAEALGGWQHVFKKPTLQRPSSAASPLSHYTGTSSYSSNPPPAWQAQELQSDL